MSQESKAMAKSAELMAGSARMMQAVAEKMASAVEQQNMLLASLVDVVDQLAKSKGGGGGIGSGSGLGSMGGGIGKLAGGLNDLARVLPSLIKGLSGFSKAEEGAKSFILFTAGLQKAIGEKTKQKFTQYSEYGRVIEVLAKGLGNLTLGLFAFDKLTSESSNERFIEFIGSLAKKFSDLNTKKLKEGAKGLGMMAESIFWFGLSLAGSAILYAVGAIGSLIIVPMIYGYSLLFEYLGKKSKDIEAGAEATKTMAWGVVAMALGVLSAGFLAGGWDKFIEGSLIVITAIAGFSAVFYMVGQFAQPIKKGGDALIFAGIAIASVALGILVMQMVMPDMKTVLLAGASIAVIGLAFGLIGPFATLIEMGAQALGLSGLALASIALGLATFNFFGITWDSMAKAGVAIVGIGATFALAGVAATFIILGAAALGIAGLAMILLAGGLWVLNKVYDSGSKGLLAKSNEDRTLLPGKKNNLEVLVDGVTMAFLSAGVAAPLIMLGGIALVLASVGMMALAGGLALMGLVYDKAVNGLLANSGEDRRLFPGKKNNLEVIIDGITMAFIGAGAASPLIILGGVAMMIASGAMITTAVGLWAMSKVYANASKMFEPGQDGTRFEEMMEAISDGMGLGPIDSAYLVMGSAAYITAGLALVSIAAGLSRFAKLVEQNIPIDKIDNMIMTVITAVAKTFTQVIDGKAVDWKQVKKGINAVSDLGNVIQGIAEGVSKMAELKFPIYDNTTGKITGYFQVGDDAFKKVAENTALVIGVIGNALAEVGNTGGETGWFSKSAAQKGADAIRGVGQDLVGIADFVLKVANLRIQKYDERTGKIIEGQTDQLSAAMLGPDGTVQQNIKNMITAISSAFAEVGKNDNGGWFKKGDIEKGKNAIMGVAGDVASIATAAKDVSEIRDFSNVKSRILEIVTVFPQAIVEAYNKVIKNLKVPMKDMVDQLASVAKPINEFIEVLTKFGESKIKDKTTESLSKAIASVLMSLNKPLAPGSIDALGKATGYMERLANTADKIDKLSNAFGKLSTSIDKFAGAFKKMDKEVLKNSDMLIQSFVLFAKVDPSAFETNSVKGQELLNYVYDKVRPIEQPTPSTPIETMPTPARAGVQPVEPAKSFTSADANKAALEQRQAALEGAIDGLQKSVTDMSGKLEAIKQALLNPGGLKVRNA